MPNIVNRLSFLQDFNNIFKNLIIIPNGSIVYSKFTIQAYKLLNKLEINQLLNQSIKWESNPNKIQNKQHFYARWIDENDIEFLWEFEIYLNETIDPLELSIEINSTNLFTGFNFISYQFLDNNNPVIDKTEYVSLLFNSPYKIINDNSISVYREIAKPLINDPLNFELEKVQIIYDYQFNYLNIKPLTGIFTEGKYYIEITPNSIQSIWNESLTWNGLNIDFIVGNIYTGISINNLISQISQINNIISNYNNWNTAYSWGNHAVNGYIKQVENGLTKVGEKFQLGGTLINQETSLEGLNKTEILNFKDIKLNLTTSDGSIPHISLGRGEDSYQLPLSNSYLGVLGASGNGSYLLPDSASIIFIAEEDMDEDHRGTSIRFNTTLVGTNLNRTVAKITDDGSFELYNKLKLYDSINTNYNHITSIDRGFQFIENVSGNVLLTSSHYIFESKVGNIYNDDNDWSVFTQNNSSFYFNSNSGTTVNNYGYISVRFNPENSIYFEISKSDNSIFNYLIIDKNYVALENQLGEYFNSTHKSSFNKIKIGNISESGNGTILYIDDFSQIVGVSKKIGLFNKNIGEYFTIQSGEQELEFNTYSSDLNLTNFAIGPDYLKFNCISQGGGYSYIRMEQAEPGNNYFLPNQGGTFVMSENLVSIYVSYTGAIDNLDLNDKTLFVSKIWNQNIRIGDFDEQQNGTYLKIDDSNELVYISKNLKVENNLFAANIGIGTTTPLHQLHILKTGTNTTPVIIEQNNASWDTKIRFKGINGNSYAEFGITKGSTPNTYSGDMGDMNYLLMAGGIERMRMFGSGGNISIGTTSNLARLAVRGDSATSGIALLIQNSTPTDLFTVDNTGKIGLRPTNFELWFGTIDNASYANLKQVSGVLTLQAPNNSSTINLNGGIIGDYLTGANVYGVNITNVVNTRTITGTYSLLRLFQYISPTSGISNTNFLEISGTIQQTGGANGIVRGLHIDTTITSASNYIGIESNGRIQIGLPTLNSWNNYAYSGRYVNSGIYLEGANSPIDLRLQATGLLGGNGVVQLLAGNNNNSYLLLGLTYLRESGGNLFIGTTNTAPSATLHARGNSPTANYVFQLENSSTTLLFRVANNGDILFGATGQVLYVGSSGLLRFGVSATNNYIVGFSGASNGITISGGGTGYGTRFVRNEIINSTSGTFTGITLEVNGGFQPTSGNASLTMIQVTGQINQTGTSTGITKGIYINQALTSTIDYRAIEAITGNSPTHTLIKLNNGSTDVFCVKGDKTIIMNIPTSSAGLPSGALWNDSGTLKIV